MKLKPFIFIKLALVLFICIGLFLTIFMVVQDVKNSGPYIFSGLFMLFPALILYGLTVGFNISKKTIKKKAERQKKVTFDDNGLTYEMPLFDTTQFINWKTIDTVIYTNYQTDDNAQFVFHLAQPPIQTMTENPFWLNKIFPFQMKNKQEITIQDDCRNFHEIPKMLETYLANTNPIDLTEDYRKGRLVSSETTIKNNTIRSQEHWIPNNNYEREKVIFDKKKKTDF